MVVATEGKLVKDKQKRSGTGKRPYTPGNATQRLHLAHGHVEAKLTKTQDGPALRCEDGTKLKLSGIDSRLAVWMLKNLDQLSEVRSWLVYPQQNGSWFAKSVDFKDPTLGVDEFRIYGRRANRPNSIFVQRNDPDLKKNYQFVSIENLPEGVEREYLKLRCKRIDDKLVFVKVE